VIVSTFFLALSCATREVRPTTLSLSLPSRRTLDSAQLNLSPLSVYKLELGGAQVNDRI
jgi:hypothetical protein